MPLGYTAQVTPRSAEARSAPLWLRLGLPIALIISLTAGFISFLNYFNYQKSYRQLNVARVTVIGRDLVQVVESGLNFGLAPKNNTQLDAALSLAKDSTEGLDFLLLTDERGGWVGGVGNAPQHNDWGARLAALGDDPYWHGEDAGTYQIGLPYRNTFGAVVGAVVMGYNKEAIDRATARMRSDLLGYWLLATVLCGALVFVVVWRLTRPIEAELREARHVLDGATAESATAPQLPLLGPVVEQGIAQFIRQARSASTALDGASRPVA